MKKNLLRVLVLLGVLVLAGLANRYGLLQRTLEWVSSFGAGGPFIFLTIYALSCVLFVPSLIFTFSSGALFGIPLGFALSLMGNAIGSTAALLIARYLARKQVEKAFEKNAQFQKFARAIEKKGWKLIVLARFSPVFPFLVGNYAFGVTRIRAADYFLATLIGSIPSSLLYAYLGFLFRSLSSFQAAGRERTPQEWLMIGFGLVATIFLTVYLRKVADNADKE